MDALTLQAGAVRSDESVNPVELLTYPYYLGSSSEVMAHQEQVSNQQIPHFSSNSRDYSMPITPLQTNINLPMATSASCVQDANASESRGVRNTRMPEIPSNLPYIPPVLPTPAKSYFVNIRYWFDPIYLSTPSPTCISPIFDIRRNFSSVQSEVPICQAVIRNPPNPEFSRDDWLVQCDKIQLKMNNFELWKQFDNHVMEMVIAKRPRKLFPLLDFSIRGLFPSMLYTIYLDFANAEEQTLRFEKNSQQWKQTLHSVIEDVHKYNERVFHHPMSPATGDKWNHDSIKFDELYVVNELRNPAGKAVRLKSLHRYMPRLIIIEAHPQNAKCIERVLVFAMVKTQFIAVTGYHSDEIRRLKTELNPNARSALLRNPSFRSAGMQLMELMQLRLTNDSTTSSSSDLTNESTSSSSSELQNDMPCAGSHIDSERLIDERPALSNSNDANDFTVASNHSNFGQSIRFAPYSRLANMPNNANPPVSNRSNCQQQEITRVQNSVPPEDWERLRLNSAPNFNQRQDQDLNEINPTSGTVHHFPRESANVPSSPFNVNETGAAVNNSLCENELLNINRSVQRDVIASLINAVRISKWELLEVFDAFGIEIPRHFELNYDLWVAISKALSSIKPGTSPSLDALLEALDRLDTFIRSPLSNPEVCQISANSSLSPTGSNNVSGNTPPNLNSDTM